MHHRRHHHPPPPLRPSHTHYLQSSSWASAGLLTDQRRAPAAHPRSGILKQLRHEITRKLKKNVSEFYNFHDFCNFRIIFDVFYYFFITKSQFRSGPNILISERSNFVVGLGLQQPCPSTAAAVARLSARHRRWWWQPCPRAPPPDGACAGARACASRARRLRAGGGVRMNGAAACWEQLAGLLRPLRN